MSNHYNDRFLEQRYEQYLEEGKSEAEAKKEAARDGVPPIELIDGERLVALFEKK